MLKLLLPLLLLIAGTGAGIGAAVLTAPDEAPSPQEETGHSQDSGSDVGHDKDKTNEGGHDSGGHRDAAEAGFVAFDHQFVVQIVQDDKVTSMVVLSLSLEAEPDLRESIHLRQPKLRDLFLRVLFDHANMGGFQGAFTSSGNLELLRSALREAAQKEMGTGIRDVLIVDIARQDS